MASKLIGPDSEGFHLAGKKEETQGLSGKCLYISASALPYTRTYMVDETAALPKGNCEKQMRTDKVIAKKTGSTFNPVHASDN